MFDDTNSVLAVLGFNLLYVTGLALALWLADRHARHPLWLAAAFYVWGALNVPQLAPLFFPDLSLSLVGKYTAIESTLWIPLIEEATKAAPLLLLALLPTIYADRPTDFVVAGALIGLGAGMTENFQRFDAVQSWEALVAHGLLWKRLVMGPLLHAGTVALVGLALGWTRCAPRPHTRLYLTPLVFAAMVGWHGLANFFNLSMWNTGVPEWLFSISVSMCTVIQLTMTLVLGASVLLARRELLHAEQAALTRYASRARDEGLLPAALAEQLPSWRKRWRTNWAGPPRARRRLLRFASRLGIIEARLEAAPSRGLARRAARLRDKVVKLARKAAPSAD